MEIAPNYEELKQTFKVLEVAESEIREAELKVRDAERRSLAYLENSPVCTKILDLDFNLQYMSSAGSKVFQHNDFTEYYGKPYPFEFYPELFKSRMIGSLKKAAETHEVVTLEAAALDLTGNEIWFYSTIVPVEDIAGELEYFMIVASDITARKQAEMALEKQNEHLEELVEQRTAELRQSQKMEALGTLAGGIAHDFNNILGAILCNTELCMKKIPADNEANKYLERISSSGHRAADLVRQIMVFSRMDVTCFKTLDLSLVVQDALDMARSTIPASIVFNLDFPDKCPAVSADETQVHQVILNLCSNASDAIGAAGGVLEVTLENSACLVSMDAGDVRCVKLTVKDSGKGISPEDQVRIFDPFFTTKEVGKGTGLGLSVVFGIMEAHKGKIAVESREGMGSIFSLYFPAIGTEIQNTRIHEAAAGKGGGHILIVDDETEIVDVYREFLEEQGFVVSICDDGADALTIFGENPNQYDLILTDHTMPYLTGEQLVPELLAIRPDIPVILSSGYSDLISEADASAIGISKVLLKPLKLSVLRNAIDECLVQKDDQVTASM